ncbi:MAG: ROK family protein [Candidatus Methylacidiphilales bacterium]|nr:ROK family protein [Candidatus Methylacidiphilales bacterium]
MNILAIDVGGSHVKALATGQTEKIKIDSGPDMTPDAMATEVVAAIAGWAYDVVSIGYPGVVIKDKPMLEPSNLGHGWVGFNYQKAFGKPVRMVNDAAMQALGSYKGGRMLFLGLGTGLGSALIIDDVLQPMELAHLPYRKGSTYEDYVGKRGLDRLGKARWREHVAVVVKLLQQALCADYVILGGGNAEKVKVLPENVFLGHNEAAFTGGFRLWTDRFGNAVQEPAPDSPVAIPQPEEMKDAPREVPTEVPPANV